MGLRSAHILGRQSQLGGILPGVQLYVRHSSASKFLVAKATLEIVIVSVTILNIILM